MDVPELQQLTLELDDFKLEDVWFTSEYAFDHQGLKITVRGEDGFMYIFDTNPAGPASLKGVFSHVVCRYEWSKIADLSRHDIVADVCAKVAEAMERRVKQADRFAS